MGTGRWAQRIRLLWRLWVQPRQKGVQAEMVSRWRHLQQCLHGQEGPLLLGLQPSPHRCWLRSSPPSRWEMDWACLHAQSQADHQGSRPAEGHSLPSQTGSKARCLLLAVPQERLPSLKAAQGCKAQANDIQAFESDRCSRPPRETEEEGCHREESSGQEGGQEDQGCPQEKEAVATQRARSKRGQAH